MRACVPAVSHPCAWDTVETLRLVRTRVDPLNMNPISYVYVWACLTRTNDVSARVRAYPLWPLTHLRLRCQTSPDHRERFMFLCVTSDGSKSQMTEKHWRNKSLKHLAEAPLEEPAIHIQASPTEGLSNVACLLLFSEWLLQPHALGLITSALEWDFCESGLTEGKAWPNWFQVPANVLSASC